MNDNPRTVTCWSSRSGLSCTRGMSAMEAAVHCSMLLSWGSRVKSWGQQPSSLLSEFTITSAVLGVLSTQSVPEAHTERVLTKWKRLGPSKHLWDIWTYWTSVSSKKKKGNCFESQRVDGAKPQERTFLLHPSAVQRCTMLKAHTKKKKNCPFISHAI